MYDHSTCVLDNKHGIFSACLNRGQRKLKDPPASKVRGAIARELVDSPNRITSEVPNTTRNNPRPPAPERENKMISVVKSTTRRHAREKARSSSATAAAAAAAAAATAVVKNSSAFNSNNNKSNNHFQKTGDDATFGGLNHLPGSYEKVSFYAGEELRRNAGIRPC